MLKTNLLWLKHFKKTFYKKVNAPLYYTPFQLGGTWSAGVAQRSVKRGQS